MASLTGQTIASSYDALLKVTDNGPITGSLKLITDGLGNNTSLSLATTSASITGTLAVSSTLSASNFSGTFSGTSSNTNTGDETQATIKSKLGAATTSVDGYLTSTDWTTFNNKVSTTRSISTTAPLAGGGDLSANRTLSISQATTSTDGYLSSTDWNTFNSKQGALTNPILGTGTRTTDYVALFSATNTITNSDIYKSGTTYYIGSSATGGLNINKALQAYDLSGGDYTLAVSNADVLINTQLRVSNYGSNTITLNSSGLNMGTLPISSATDITGSGKLSIANIGASGTLNIGSTTTATKRLELTADNNSGENNTLRFVDTDTTSVANQVIGKIEFFSNDATAPGGSVKAYISANSLDTSPDAYLDFATDTTTGTPTVRQRIAADGTILIAGAVDNGSGNIVQVNGGLDYNIIIRGTSSTAYTLLLADKGKYVRFTSTTAVAVTIPTNASVAFPIGTQIWFYQVNLNGIPTFSGDTGVTLRTRSSTRQPFGQYAEVKLTKIATDEWVLSGDLKA